MDKADIYKIYQLGIALAPIKELRHDARAIDAFQPVFGAKNALEELLGENGAAKIDICRGDVQQLYDAVNRAFKAHFWDAQKERMAFPAEAVKFGHFHVWEISSALQSFEPVFRAEMQVAAAYWVPRKGTYNTTELVNHADGCFAVDLLGTIGEMGLTEYRAAGKCFAFGLYSATGYHACRAVEAVLRKYYQHYLGKPSGEKMQWGQMLEELEGVSASARPAEKTLAYIRHVKDHDRNPLSHTRVVLDEQDADGLLKFASIVMVAMAREMKPAIQLIPAEPLKLVGDAS